MPLSTAKALPTYTHTSWIYLEALLILGFLAWPLFPWFVVEHCCCTSKSTVRKFSNYYGGIFITNMNELQNMVLQMLSPQLYSLFINNQGGFNFEMMENCPVWQNYQHCPEWCTKGCISLRTLVSICSFMVPWSTEESLIQYGSCILVKPECKHISFLTVMFLSGLMSPYTTGVATRSEAGESHQSHLENKIFIESGLKMFFLTDCRSQEWVFYTYPRFRRGWSRNKL